MSSKYRNYGKGKLSNSEVEAYLIARMPATRGAITQVFQEIADKIPTVHSFLDIGAGPGTGLLAALEVFDEITEAVLIEENSAMVAHKQIEAQWVRKCASKVEFPPSDLVLFGYSYGEIEDPQILKRAWEAAGVLVIVEPGTPRGFETILKARDMLDGLGGHLIAPCPHNGQCPLLGSRDWCHFSTRIRRSKEHRFLKEGSLGWEDEKYSYIAFGKNRLEMSKGRILRHPQVHKGHLLFELCTPDGVEKKKISKKEKALYKRAKKLKWGHSFFESIIEESDDHSC